MSRLSNPPKLQSWIPPAITWITEPSAFVVEVKADDLDLVKFISLGELDIIAYGPKLSAFTHAALIGTETLQGQLIKAVWDSKKLKPLGQRIKSGAKLTAYCKGVFLLPARNTIAVLVSQLKPDSPSKGISVEVKVKADALLKQHLEHLEQFTAEAARVKENDRVRMESLSPEKRDTYKRALEIGNLMTIKRPPELSAKGLLEVLPSAVTFTQSSDISKNQRVAIAEIASSKLSLPREGDYSGILFPSAGMLSKAIVTWSPYSGIPAYPEVRWAVQRRIPAALRKPRVQEIGRPHFDSNISAISNSTFVGGFDPSSTKWSEVLSDLQLDLSDQANRADQVRRGIKTQGFEAIAWFQPYHSWTEETWGIYIDASKLDDLACGFIEDLQRQRTRPSHSLAALLAFNLVYEHELFHARVEGALSWLELSAVQPKHQPYNKKVYDVLRETPDWLEEALANWWSWNWFKAPETQSLITSFGSNAEAVEKVAITSLDLSPPGYQDWRRGSELETWRTFATQLCTAKPKLSAPGIGLPVDSILNGNLPYDFLASDIPLYFVGNGQIADRLLSHPGSLNVVARRELEKALKYFRHILDASGGKGGHQKWTGPDQRAFIVPTRDPVSIGVFNSFLKHVGIDKDTYVNKIRPNL